VAERHLVLRKLDLLIKKGLTVGTVVWLLSDWFWHNRLNLFRKLNKLVKSVNELLLFYID
jgi:hypothetical protein